jgi:carbonic anhydrase/acetyltransferase-like protein (isoleucine patch superfamily)
MQVSKTLFAKNRSSLARTLVTA